RAEPVHRVRPDRPALLVGRADQEPGRRVLRVAAAARRRRPRGGTARRDHEGGPGMNYIGGVDVGSTQTKAVILDDDDKGAGRAWRRADAPANEGPPSAPPAGPPPGGRNPRRCAATGTAGPAREHWSTRMPARRPSRRTRRARPWPTPGSTRRRSCAAQAP